jgi:nickel/cobalt exporter
MVAGRYMKTKIACLALLLFLLICPDTATAFASSDQPSAQAPVETVSQQLINLFQHNTWYGKLTKLQQSLNKDMAWKIRDLKQQQDPLLLLYLALLAFIYGIFHALGPGHGKSVISSWIIAQPRRLGTVLSVSLAAAAAHALSATLMVVGTYVLLGKLAAVSTQKLNAYLQITAALLVIGIGVTMLIRLLYNRFAATRSEQEQRLPEMWGKPAVIALSVGVVPCPVTSVILIFCLTLGLAWQGILLVMSFAAGMGATLACVAGLVWSLQERIIMRPQSGFHTLFAKVLPLAGGIFLVAIGLVLLNSLL